MLALSSDYTPKVTSYSGHAEGARRLARVPRGSVRGHWKLWDGQG